MKQNSHWRKAVWIVASICALLTLLLLASQVWGVSWGELVRQALLPARGQQDVVMTINGKPVRLEAIELARGMRQLFSETPLSDAEAYRQTLDQFARDAVLSQEARRRGLSVSEQETREYWEQIQADMAAAPEPKRAEMLKVLQTQQETLGLTEAEAEERVLQAYQEGLLIGKLYQALEREAPLPTEEEIDLYLARQPSPNVLILIPIEFTDVESARATYHELQGLAATMPQQEFETTFVRYAYRLGDYEESQPVHQTFHFATPEELPDFARDAVGKAEDSMGIFERSDGTAVIYLVLKSVTVPTAGLREAVRMSLAREKQQQYVRSVEDELLKQADIRVYLQRLPPAAREVIPETWKREAD